MSRRLPEGWSMRQCRDSVFSFNKLVHWQERIDPPPDSDGYDDTMRLYIRIHPVQTDSEKTIHKNVLERFNAEIEQLKQHRLDTNYRNKRGFFDWWGKLIQLEGLKLMFEFTYFKKCSTTYYYWYLFDKLKYYDEKIDAEAEQVKSIVAAYLVWTFK
jgi:hypothetical protein